MPDAQGDPKRVLNPLKLELLPVELSPGSLQEHRVLSMAEPWLPPPSLKTFGSFFLEKAGRQERGLSW